MSSVLSFGYTVVGTLDIERWSKFGAQVMGMQVAEQQKDRLLLRMDERSYRYDIRRASTEGVQAVGLQVLDKQSLTEISSRLQEAGYSVSTPSAEHLGERMVRGMTIFRDPDNQYDIELYYGMMEAHEPFVSQTDYKFVAGDLGIGHVLQVVSDPEVYRHLYLDVLGYRLSDEIETTPGNFATFLRCNARHHSFAFSKQSGVRPLGVGHIMVEVAELDMVGKTLDKGKAGLAKVTGSLGRHTNDKMLSMYIQSPSGFGIEYGVGGILIDEATWVPKVYNEAHYWGHDRENAPKVINPS